MNSLYHAEHNEKVCNYLNKKPDFTDWVITTAFYSALHFIDHKVFPFSISKNGKKIRYKDFDNYYRFNNPLNLSKHEIRSSMVSEKHPSIANDYNRLRDLCGTARYNNYNFPREISNDARKRLKKIKEYCTK